MPTNVVKTQTDERHWDKAKTLAREEHPEFKEGSDQFYKYTMGIYKKMTKSASAEELIDNLYQEGIISPFARRTFQENTKLAEVKEILGKKAKGDWGSAVTNGLITAGALTAGGLGLEAGIKGYQSIKNKLMRKKRIDEAKKFEPTIGEMDPKLVTESMKTLEKLNPDYASSPLITASTLKSIHMWGGLSPEQANMLKDQEKFRPARDYFREGWKRADGLDKEAKSFSKGVKKSLVGGLSTGVGAAAIGVAATAGGYLAAKAINSFTRNKRMNEIKAAYPELNKYEPKKLETSLKTIERVNPVFAKDPLVAGGYIKQIIKEKGISPKTSEGLAGAAGDIYDYTPAKFFVFKG